MSSASYSQLTLNGLWKNNPALVQLVVMSGRKIPSI